MSGAIDRSVGEMKIVGRAIDRESGHTLYTKLFTSTVRASTWARNVRDDTLDVKFNLSTDPTEDQA